MKIARCRGCCSVPATNVAGDRDDWMPSQVKVKMARLTPERTAAFERNILRTKDVALADDDDTIIVSCTLPMLTSVLGSIDPDH